MRTNRKISNGIRRVVFFIVIHTYKRVYIFIDSFEFNSSEIEFSLISILFKRPFFFY